MKPKKHPGVYVPPPLIYAAFFVCSIFLQKLYPLNANRLHANAFRILGIMLIGLHILLASVSIRRFIISKNTLVTVKPANSLQTTGIYGISRNPMYLSLVCLYSGFAFLFGNYWTFILLLPLVWVIQEYVIKKEESYLQQAFGDAYDAYTKKVRRWI